MHCFGKQVWCCSCFKDLISVCYRKSSGLNTEFPVLYLLLSMGWSLPFQKDPVLCSLKMCWTTQDFILTAVSPSLLIRSISLPWICWSGRDLHPVFSKLCLTSHHPLSKLLRKLTILVRSFWPLLRHPISCLPHGPFTWQFIILNLCN